MPAKATAAINPTAYSAVVIPSSRRYIARSFLSTRSPSVRRRLVRRAVTSFRRRRRTAQRQFAICGQIRPLWMARRNCQSHVVGAPGFSTADAVIHRSRSLATGGTAERVRGRPNPSRGGALPRQPRPLLLTADPKLLDQLLGLAAAAGAAVDVAIELTTCRPQWTDAPLVLLGGDMAASAGARVEAPGRVQLLTGGSDSPELSNIADAVGAEEVICLEHGEADLVERLADATEPPVPARVIGLVGGCGGAGANTLAAGLALTAAGRGPSWLVDLDPLGGGADTGLGAELSAGARWNDLQTLTGRLSPHALRAALPAVAGVTVVAVGGDAVRELTPEAVRAGVTAAGRGRGEGAGARGGAGGRVGGRTGRRNDRAGPRPASHGGARRCRRRRRRVACRRAGRGASRDRGAQGRGVSCPSGAETARRRSRRSGRSAQRGGRARLGSAARGRAARRGNRACRDAEG